MKIEKATEFVRRIRNYLLFVLFIVLLRWAFIAATHAADLWEDYRIESMRVDRTDNVQRYHHSRIATLLLQQEMREWMDECNILSSHLEMQGIVLNIMCQPDLMGLDTYLEVYLNTIKVETFTNRVNI